MTGQLATASLFSGHVDAYGLRVSQRHRRHRRTHGFETASTHHRPHQIQSRHLRPPFGARLAHDVMRTIGTTSLILRQS